MLKTITVEISRLDDRAYVLEALQTHGDEWIPIVSNIKNWDDAVADAACKACPRALLKMPRQFHTEARLALLSRYNAAVNKAFVAKSNTQARMLKLQTSLRRLELRVAREMARF